MFGFTHHNIKTPTKIELNERKVFKVIQIIILSQSKMNEHDYDMHYIYLRTNTLFRNYLPGIDKISKISVSLCPLNKGSLITFL